MCPARNIQQNCVVLGVSVCDDNGVHDDDDDDDDDDSDENVVVDDDDDNDETFGDVDDFDGSSE